MYKCTAGGVRVDWQFPLDSDWGRAGGETGERREREGGGYLLPLCSVWSTVCTLISGLIIGAGWPERTKSSEPTLSGLLVDIRFSVDFHQGRFRPLEDL